MPRSPSPVRSTSPPARSRSIWPIILIGALAVFGVIAAVLPASIAARFLPPTIHAEDFSGTLWHGSAGRITVNGRDAGAIEWWLHPAALFTLHVAANLHWVKASFVIDGAVNLGRASLEAHEVKGGGPLEDLRDFGVPADWRGNATIDFHELRTDFAALQAAVGDIRVADLTASRIAGGANLGGFELRVPAGAVGAAGNLSADLQDTGGPLEVRATVHYTAQQQTGILTGTLKPRPGAPPALLDQLQSISQLRGHDAEGRIPVDLEFAL
jgi:Type II secretion system (T2SS), protein N